jgi:hypothetical protein
VAVAGCSWYRWKEQISAVISVPKQTQQRQYFTTCHPNKQPQPSNSQQKKKKKKKMPKSDKTSHSHANSGSGRPAVAPLESPALSGCSGAGVVWLWQKLARTRAVERGSPGGRRAAQCRSSQTQSFQLGVLKKKFNLKNNNK